MKFYEKLGVKFNNTFSDGAYFLLINIFALAMVILALVALSPNH